MRVDEGQTICPYIHKAVYFLTLPINLRSSLLEAKTYNKKKTYPPWDENGTSQVHRAQWYHCERTRLV